MIPTRTQTLALTSLLMLLPGVMHGQTPIVPANSVVNNASYSFGSNSVAPGAIVAIFGGNLTNGTSCLGFQGCNQTLDPATNLLRTTLSGAQVTVNGAPVPIFYAAPGQLGVQIPTTLTGTSATVQVTVNGQTSSPQNFPVSPLAPGIFSINSQGWGQGAIQVANSRTFAAPERSIPGEQSRRVFPGEFLTIYCSGLGQVAPPIATGALPGANPVLAAVTRPRVFIGGVEANVSFAGLVPGNAGLYQVNVRVPEGVPSGWSVPVFMTSGGIRSNMVTIGVESPGAAGRDNPVILQGAGNTARGTIYGHDFFSGAAARATVTGGVELTATGTTSGSQTLFSVTGTGGGVVSCQRLTGSDTIGNWTASVTGSATVSPAIATQAVNGGDLSGAYTISLTLTACGVTENYSGNGSIAGTVNPGGGFALSLIESQN